MLVQVLTDHKKLKYFMTTKKLTPRQARWTKFLSEFNFVISYQSGKKNNKANALTRKSGDCPIDKKNERLEHHMQVLLPLECFEQPTEVQAIEENKNTRAYAGTPNPIIPSVVGQKKLHEVENSEMTLPKKVSNANRKDDLYNSIYAHLKDPTKHAKPKGVKLNGCGMGKDLLIRDNQLWVPDNKGLKLRAIKKIYDQLAVGHPGVEKMLSMICCHYYWPCMQQTLEQYVWNCHVCRRAKVVHNTNNSLFQLLPVPKKLWVDVTMNIVMGLSKCHIYGQIYNAIFMVIDWLLKEKHYISCSEDNESTLAKATAELFMQHIWSREGLLISMTSDRGPQFVAKMWDFLCKLLGIKAKFSTAWHPKTNSQSEIANQEMEQYLRSYVNHFQDDWVCLLLMAEFAGNANTSASIKIPLFLSSQGRILCMSFDSVILLAFSTHKRLANAQAKSLANWMQEVWEFS